MSPADARKNVGVIAELDRERRWFWNDTQSVRYSAPATEILAAWREEWSECGFARSIDALGLEEAAKAYIEAVERQAREMARSYPPLPRQLSLFGEAA